MRRYPKYKASGVDWIGEIPMHWVAKKLRYFCSMKSGNGFSHDLQGRIGLEIPFFKVADTNTPENKLEMLYAQNTVSSQDVSDFKFILHKPKSIVFPKVGAALLLNKRNILTKKSCIDNNMMSLYSNQSSHKFLYYAMLNVDFKRHHRIGGTVPSINESEVGSIPIAYPTISEQTQIADFLDRKTGQIDELIRIKERRIELLQEQRTTLINQAVTKGLDPNVEMKPSGVEWIGEIPKHWTVTRLKYLGESIIGLSYKPEDVTDEENGTLVLRASNIQDGKPSFLDNVYVNAEIDERLCLKEGDILICSRSGSRDLIGKNMTITKELEGITFGVFMTVFRTKFVRFISYFLNSQIFKNQSGLFLTSTINQLTINTLNNFLICLPTDEEEQTQIADFLERKTEQIDELISAEQRKIELLKEYRQSLISEAVTGKIDVRNEA